MFCEQNESDLPIIYAHLAVNFVTQMQNIVSFIKYNDIAP